MEISSLLFNQSKSIKRKYLFNRILIISTFNKINNINEIKSSEINDNYIFDLCYRIDEFEILINLYNFKCIILYYVLPTFENYIKNKEKEFNILYIKNVIMVLFIVWKLFI